MIESEAFCAVAALVHNQDPIGSAGVSGKSISSLFFFEMPLPWSDQDPYPDPSGSISQRVRAVQREYQAQREDVSPGVGIPFSFAFAPDPEWSEPSRRRVLIATQPAAPFSQYDLLEFLLPPDVAVLVQMARAFFHTPHDLSAFDESLSPNPGGREVFVCTHGSTDICCGMLGIPAYRQMRTSNAEARVWRTMHIQGHRFAPTVWDFPSGYEWAFLDETAIQRVLFRLGPAQALSSKIRGWSALPSPLQVLDRQGFVDRGWEWLLYERTGSILQSDAAAKQWRVRLRFEAPSGRSGVYEGLVRVARELSDTGCGNTPFERPTRTSPEYLLEEFQEIPS